MLESDDAIQEDTVFMGIAIVLMLIYVALALGRMSWVEGRILLACSVMMVVGFSLGTATIFTFFIYIFVFLVLFLNIYVDTLWSIEGSVRFRSPESRRYLVTMEGAVHPSSIIISRLPLY